MNTAEAILHLKRLGWHVSKEGKNYRAHTIGYKKYCTSPAWFIGPEKDYDIYNPRELIRLARSQSADPSGNTRIKKDIKTGQKRKERPKVRDTLLTKDADKINDLNTRKLDGAWNYD